MQSYYLSLSDVHIKIFARGYKTLRDSSGDEEVLEALWLYKTTIFEYETVFSSVVSRMWGDHYRGTVAEKRGEIWNV